MFRQREGGGWGGLDAARWEGILPRARRDFLHWLYLARIVVVSGILLAALLVWGRAEPEQTFLATVMFLAALAMTGGAAWFTHVLRREPGRKFFYSHVLFDVLLVTGIVHVTGGAESNFAWLYILVISEGALLLHLSGGVLLGVLAAVLYAADIVWGHGETVTGPVALQVGLFALVAVVTGVLGDRLRRAGTALGEVETELRRLKADTGKILETIDTGVLTVDEGERLVYMNPAAEALLGVHQAQWQGAPVLDVIARVSPGLAEQLRGALSRGTPLYRDRTVVNRDGERIVLGIGVAVREEEGELRAATAIFQDITDAERMEALNRRNERLEAVAELSAAMAHEIKNPLSSIRSAVEQFARPSLKENDRENLTRMVVRESERLSRLLSDFIDYSRVRIGALRPVELRGLVAECAAVVREHPDAEGRGVRVEVEGVEGDELEVPGDEDLLHRAVFNLLLNAVQFSPEEGTVRIRLEDLRGRGGDRGVDVPDPVRIRIRDEGPGIPRDEADRIFDPFFTTRKGGSGLGLAVVHRAVEAHKGTVLVDCPEGGGTEFVLYLPGSGMDDAGAGGEP